MSIVIPKLAKDAGLIAAFQTNNLETLRKQKFADSLENAFLSSAGDFYSVLNRMSNEPDFKRVLTEFALTEFKRGLLGANVVAFRPRIVKPGPQERYVTCVPFVPLKLAAGAFGDPQHLDDEGFEWTSIETRHRLRPGMFVAQVVGTPPWCQPFLTGRTAFLPHQLKAHVRARRYWCNCAMPLTPRPASATPSSAMTAKRRRWVTVGSMKKSRSSPSTRTSNQLF
jgi:hypothetical protein